MPAITLYVRKEHEKALEILKQHNVNLNELFIGEMLRELDKHRGDSLPEKIADYCQSMFLRWHNEMFKKYKEGKICKAGDVYVTNDEVFSKWELLANTPFSMLADWEKDIFLKDAREILKIISNK